MSHAGRQARCSARPAQGPERMGSRRGVVGCCLVHLLLGATVLPSSCSVALHGMVFAAGTALC